MFNLLKLRARATNTVVTNTAVLYFQKAASAGQHTFFNILKYVLPIHLLRNQGITLIRCGPNALLFFLSNKSSNSGI
jgi:hypothetical protein